MRKILTTWLALFSLSCFGQDLEPGLLGEYFSVARSAGDFPDLEPNQKPFLKRIDKTINFEKGARMPGVKWTNDFLVRWTGKIRVPTTDKYKFFLESDDGSQLFVYNRKVVDNGGFHGMKEASGEVELPAGDHPLRIDFFQYISLVGCKLYWESSTIKKQIVPESALVHEVVVPPALEPGPGLIADVFDMHSQLWFLPEFQVYEKPTLSRVDLGIAFPDGDSFSLPRMRDHFYIRWTGKIDLPQTGTYIFTLSSDDGSRLTIDGKKLIDHDGLHGMSDKSGQAQLVAGTHDIKLDYFQNEKGANCVLWWEGPDLKKDVVPRTAFSH